jgi:putative AlgH/UPF0301 family transcriptional regulator
METLKVHFLVPTAKNPDRGLYFIFHHESEGILAFDITREHPDIPFRHFDTLIDGAGFRTPEDIVLLGGPEHPGTAMLVLHDNPLQGGESHKLSAAFALHSYKFVLIPGQPPSLARSDDDVAGRLSFAPHTNFILCMGFRLWSMEALEAELKDWQWTFLPAMPEIVFESRHGERLQKALFAIN